ncbi:uncharacterized protein LOC105390657 [Plutella xylostella]|uniref:uncharacterized protein LOC105390657 n=1 Tax=Plutella xylostella TaxID=51655 RepID=UPI00203301AF|nr:uncharacterized protein LOC105390657 [Plutella xylostella]
MRLAILLIVFVCIVSANAADMIVGDTVHRKMVFHQRVKEFAIPFKKRIKTLTYVDVEKRLIKGVQVLDADFSLASANITEGGVGFHHVTVRMKSQRSHPLNYEVEVYV